MGKKRKKFSKLMQMLTGKIYIDHRQGKDQSYYDKFTNTKPTEYTRKHIFLFLIWLWGFILGFPILAGFLGAYTTDYSSTLISIVCLSVFFIAWMSMWAIGRQNWYFQEIFDSFDYTNDPDCYDNADDARVFVIEEKIAEARVTNDIGKVTECRQNIKKIVKHGKISKSTKEYLEDKYYYLMK